MFVWWGSVQDHDAGGRERAAQFPTENGRVPWVRRTTGCRFTGRQPRTSTGGMLCLQSALRHSYHSSEFSHACWLVVVITFGFCSNSFVDFRTVSLEEGEHLANCVIESWADGVMKKLWYWMQRLSGCEWNELREYTHCVFKRSLSLFKCQNSVTPLHVAFRGASSTEASSTSTSTSSLCALQVHITFAIADVRKHRSGAPFSKKS